MIENSSVMTSKNVAGGGEQPHEELKNHLDWYVVCGADTVICPGD